MSPARPEKIIVVAMTRQRVIGRGGAMPWHLPEELELFRQVTWGGTLVMGRRTFQAIGRPLPGRTNIVISRTFQGGDKVTVCSEFEEGIWTAERLGRPVFIIGGEDIYRQALPLADRLFVSLLKDNHPGDTFFPAVSWTDWRLEGVREFEDFCHGRYRRISDAS